MTNLQFAISVLKCSGYVARTQVLCHASLTNKQRNYYVLFVQNSSYRHGLLRNKMKNKGLEYNKWIFQDLEKLIQVKM